MGANLPKDGVSDWAPSAPTGDNKAKLFSTMARENPDSVNAVNEQKPLIGKKFGIPCDNTLGKKGRDF